jgi:hypothetical protein
MPKTLIARISKMHQYDPSQNKITWEDKTPDRWNKIYNQLNSNDNAIFIGPKKIYFANIESKNTGRQIICISVQEIQCTNDQLLQIHQIHPENISRVKANFTPFIHPIEIDTKQILNDIRQNKFIGYYIFSNLSTYQANSKSLKINDRIVLLYEDLTLSKLMLHTDQGLKPTFEINISVAGRTLKEILEINKKAKDHSESSNNINRIKTIINDIKKDGFYKFKTFFSYYDSLFNKWTYSAKEDSALDLHTNPTSHTELVDDYSGNEHSLNQILYGPPGTGKTYHTIEESLKIIGLDTNNLTRKELKFQFEEFVRLGRIVFTTFHQSMSYEDFIEGIKPLEPNKEGDPLTYKVVPGIFKALCVEAAFSIAVNNIDDSTSNIFDFSFEFDNYVDAIEEKLLKGETVSLISKNGGHVLVDSISPQGNIIIKHKNGATTYTVSKSRLMKLYSQLPNARDIKNINTQIREIIGGSNTSAYWSVLNDFSNIARTKEPNLKSKIYTYEEKVDIVSALNSFDFRKKKVHPYILIIDEINRGNVSQIFGELITLIEEDKRLGNDESIKVMLPYSKESFGVPPNLYIIGTMNTADRSVEALDSALRRRFNFIEMLPRPELVSPQKMIWDLWWKFPKVEWDNPVYKSCEDQIYSFLGIENDFDTDQAMWNKMEAEGKKEYQFEYFKSVKINGVNLELILNTINKRITKLIDKDHQIGHSYFINVHSISKLKNVFKSKIVPLLQEYFFGDTGKIGLVLGKGFIQSDKEFETNIFADFDEYDSSEFNEIQVYTIKDIGKMADDDFKSAIRYLLNN